MKFDFNKGQQPFVPREDGIFAPPSPGTKPLEFEKVQGDHLPEATWVVPGQVEKLLDTNKK